MNTMNMPMSYGGVQGAGFNRIIRRPLTEVERQLGVGYYKTVQRALRGVAVVSMVFFFMNTFLLTGFSDPVLQDTLSTVFSVFALVFGGVAIVMSINSLIVRKKITDAMNDGTGIEVTGPAYRASTMQKVQSWNIGPVSLIASREAMGILQEGAQTTVLCIPRLKVALTINNYGLKNGARVMFPPNLEAMAIPVGLVAMPTAVQPTWTGNPSNNPPIQHPQPLLLPSNEEEPPPPPDW